MGFLEGNESCHLPNRVNNRKGILGNAAALQHLFKVVLLSQATDKYQFSSGIYLHAELTVTIANVNIPAVPMLTCTRLKATTSKAFPCWKRLVFFNCWNCICISLEAVSISLPPSCRMNSVAYRALDDHQGRNEIWWLRTFLAGDFFFLGRTDLYMKGNRLFSMNSNLNLLLVF